MCVCPRNPVLRLALLVGGAALTALAVTGCAGSPSTPTIFSVVVGETAMPGMDMPGMSQNSYAVEVVFPSAVIAGSNDVAVRVRDAATGEPLRNAVVRLAVETATEVNAQGAAASDDVTMPGHGDAAADGHDSGPTATDAAVVAEDHDSAAMPSHQTAETNAVDNPASDSAGHGHGDASDAPATLAASSVPGEYAGQVQFSDVGEWRLTVTVTAEGEQPPGDDRGLPQAAEVAVTVARDQGRLIVLGGFLGVNIAILATAAITKHKTVKG